MKNGKEKEIHKQQKIVLIDQVNNLFYYIKQIVILYNYWLCILFYLLMRHTVVMVIRHYSTSLVLPEQCNHLRSENIINSLLFVSFVLC